MTGLQATEKGTDELEVERTAEKQEELMLIKNFNQNSEFHSKHPTGDFHVSASDDLRLIPHTNYIPLGGKAQK